MSPIHKHRYNYTLQFGTRPREISFVHDALTYNLGELVNLAPSAIPRLNLTKVGTVRVFHDSVDALTQLEFNLRSNSGGGFRVVSLKGAEAIAR